MSFQFVPLDYAPFAPLFDASAAELARRSAVSVIADCAPGYPCRVSLEDAALGDRVILVNYRHLPEKTPYSASHAIYVHQNARPANPAPGTVPQMLQSRVLSLRGFDRDHMMRAGSVVAGADLGAQIPALFQDPDMAYAHVHFAGRGCFAARVNRADRDL